MLSLLVPSTVQTAEHFGPDDPTLTAEPLEEPLIAKAVEKRRREFITARHCARQALGKLGKDPVPILRGEKREPLWPHGVVGSLTHTNGYRGAAVAFALQVRSIGIDAEPHETLPPGVYDSVALASEQTRLAQLTQHHPTVHWDRVLFCAKEATYKAWYPITQRWLGFEDADIDLRYAEDFAETRTDQQGAEAQTYYRGSFTSTILIDPSTADRSEPLRELYGHWLVSDSYILTAVVVQ